MNKLTDKQEEQLANRIQKEFYMICRMKGIDYFLLPKAIREIMLECFQAGVKFSDEELKRIAKEVKE